MKREKWASSWGAYLSTAGGAVGLGSFWSVLGFIFHRGVVFVIAYLVFTLFFCIPGLISDLLVGRTTNRTPVLAFAELAPGKYIRYTGYIYFMSVVCTLLFYTVQGGYFIYYTFLELFGCITDRSYYALYMLWKDVSLSPIISLGCTYINLSLAISVVYLGVKQGIEKVSSYIMVAFFLILLGMACFSVTLPHFADVVKMIFVPRLEQLTATNILAGLGSAFFISSAGSC